MTGVTQWELNASPTEWAPPVSFSVGFPTAGDIGTLAPPTRPGPHWLFSMAQEIRAVIEEAGMTFDPTDPTQFLAAILTLAAPRVAPVAGFLVSPLSGPAPLSVTFTDTTTESPTSWAWTFGDGGTSTAQNPVYTYAAAGTYTVTLTATVRGAPYIATLPNVVNVAIDAGDPHFSNVILLMNGDTLTEVTGRTVTPFSAAPTIVTSDSDFPHGAIQVGSGAGNYGLEIGLFSDTNVDYGSGDFTAEFDYKLTSAPTATYPAIFHLAATSGLQLALLDHHAAIGANAAYTFGSTFPLMNRPSAVGVLYQEAIVRQGTTIYHFIDGVLTDTLTGWSGDFNMSGTVGVGNTIPYGTANSSIALIGKMRVTKGVARYTTSYTPTRDLWPTS